MNKAKLNNFNDIYNKTYNNTMMSIHIVHIQMMLKI